LRYCFSYTCVVVYATPVASLPFAITVSVFRSADRVHVAVSLPTSSPSSVRSIVFASTRFRATLALPWLGMGYSFPSNLAVYL